MIEIICPCSKEELAQLIDFVSHGKIEFYEKTASLKILENLKKILGFKADFEFPENFSLEQFENSTENVNIERTFDANIAMEVNTAETCENVSQKANVDSVQKSIPLEMTLLTLKDNLNRIMKMFCTKPLRWMRNLKL